MSPEALTPSAPEPENLPAACGDLANSSLPSADRNQTSPEALIEEALDKINFDSLRHLFLKKLANGVDQLLEQNTQVSIEKATELIKSIELLSSGSEGEIFFKAKDPIKASFEDMRIQNCELIDGRINGKAWVNGKNLPLLNGRFVTHIDDREIVDCDSIHNVDFKLNGMIRFSKGPLLPVIDGKVIEEVEGRKVEGCKYIRNINGKLNGCIVSSGRNLPVVDGKIIDQIDGRQIFDFEDFENIGGRLNGRLSVTGERYKYLPVIDGQLITSISEEKIVDSRKVKNVNGCLNAEVMFSDYGYEWYPIRNGFLKPVKPR